jgi:hypothetical protein
MPFLKNECTCNMDQQGTEHLLTPSRGRLNFKKMSLQTSTWRLSRLEVPKQGVKRPLVGLKALWHLNILNTIRKLLPLHLSFILQHTYGPTMVVPIWNTLYGAIPNNRNVVEYWLSSDWQINQKSL